MASSFNRQRTQRAVPPPVRENLESRDGRGHQKTVALFIVPAIPAHGVV
nr:MAG TPA: hypothetical protein [Caudoviricetes sp.]